MNFNPVYFIVIGAICAAVSLSTAILTLFEEHKRVKQAKRHQPPQADEIPSTRGRSSIHVQFVASPPTASLSR